MLKKIFFLKNIQVYEKINKVLIIEEPEFKIVKKINEDLIKKKILKSREQRPLRKKLRGNFPGSQ